MLSQDQNELLVRVGPGTAMGNFLRLYWMPFLLSGDLVADGTPKRVRLMGEDLVAFRDSEGRVGLVDHACAHRRAPMMFARNEECGLRCVYHGWKFDVTGQCVDMPAEPLESRFKDRVQIKAYPCRERNGVLWTYMGPEKESLPPLPNVEWNLVSAEQVHVSLRVQECNWLQALEGDIDSAHAAFLHGRVDANGRMARILATRDLRPTFDVMRQDFGVSIAARRVLDNEIYYRVNQFMLPNYTLTPPQRDFPELTGHAWVPMDDEHTLVVMFSYHPNAPLYEKTRRLFEEGYKGRETGHPSRHSYRDDNPTAPYAGLWSKFGRDNDYLFDEESQRTTWFSGLPGLWVQDAACQEALGPICDRTQEKLGVSDTGIVVTRRALTDAVRAHRDGGTVPASVNNPDLFMVRAVSLHLNPEESCWEAGRLHMTARLGEGFGYQP
ncbi:MAG TPA: Rieske 2Fe-2S domain-containing protein [Hyphomicrobiales bacterium]|nr:Rieske 2Fe-2S domain-containing protein [Hyphomicrobiales bacterium]